MGSPITAYVLDIYFLIVKIDLTSSTVNCPGAIALPSDTYVYGLPKSKQSNRDILPKFPIENAINFTPLLFLYSDNIRDPSLIDFAIVTILIFFENFLISDNFFCITEMFGVCLKLCQETRISVPVLFKKC